MSRGGLAATPWTWPDGRGAGASVVADAVSVRESYLVPGETYRDVSVFSEDEWVTLPSMLERDAESAGPQQ